MIESLCELFPMFTIDELRDHPTNVDHSEDLVTELFDEATALIQSETERKRKKKIYFCNNQNNTLQMLEHQYIWMPFMNYKQCSLLLQLNLWRKYYNRIII